MTTLHQTHLESLEALENFERYLKITAPYSAASFIFLEKVENNERADGILFKHDFIDDKWLLWKAAWLAKKENIVVERVKGAKVQPEDPAALIAFENFIQDSVSYSMVSKNPLEKIPKIYEASNPEFLDRIIDSLWYLWLIAWKTKI